MLSLKKKLYIKTDDKVYLAMYIESLYKVVFGERKYILTRQVIHHKVNLG